MATGGGSTSGATVPSSGTTIPATAVVPAWEAEIVSLTWKQGGAASIRAARVTIGATNTVATIPTPHWEDGATIEEEDSPDNYHFNTGSRRAGVVLVKAVGRDDAELEVVINVRRSVGITAASGTLKTRLGKMIRSSATASDYLTLEGNCPTAVGTHTITIKTTNLPETVEAYEDNCTWQMTIGSAAPINLKKAGATENQKTRLEVYAILATPPAFYTQGVWIEALRFLFKDAKVFGNKTIGTIAEKVTKHLHTTHGMTYDTARGGANFLGGGNFNSLSFYLFRYLKKEGYITPSAPNQVNCYDQASAAQVFCGTLGIETQWIFMDPFGYINTIDLVGIGNCNNPFFGTNRTRAVIAAGSADYGSRTAFGNHAFARIGGNATITTGNKKTDHILDPCALYPGNGVLMAYARVSIDQDTTFARNFGGYSINTTATPPETRDAAFTRCVSSFSSVKTGIIRVVAS